MHDERARHLLGFDRANCLDGSSGNISIFLGIISAKILTIEGNERCAAMERISRSASLPQGRRVKGYKDSLPSTFYLTGDHHASARRKD